MSSDASPARLCADLARTLAPRGGTVADRLAQWDAAHASLLALYRHNAPAARLGLLALPYATTWQPLINATLDALPEVLDSWRAVHTAEKSEASAAADDDDDDDDSRDNHVRTQSRLASASRVLLLAKNLCPCSPPFQRRVRRQLLQRAACRAGQALVQALALQQQVEEDEVCIDVQPALLNLLKLYANALTPGAVTDAPADDDEAGDPSQAWRWVRDLLWPSVLRPLLPLATAASSPHPELVSAAACVVHHSLLCGAPEADTREDLREEVRAAAGEMVEEDVLYELLRASLPGAVERLREANEEEDQAQAASSSQAATSKPPPPALTLFDWHPPSGEPFWLLHLLSLALRASTRTVPRLRERAADEEWTFLLRLVELWAEGLDQAEVVTAPIAELTGPSPVSTPADDAPAPSGKLERTAEAVAANMIRLAQWLQERDPVPLPVGAKPPTSDANDAAAASSASAAARVPTSSLPVDASTSSLLNSLGHVLLHRHWDRSLVSHSLRSGLLLQHFAATLLDLLDAADRWDGGAAFSELYRPPGHTRHTKRSEDERDYVNQFGGKGEASGSSSAPAAASPPLQRRTPYQFKSHLLRLLSALAYRHRSFQTAFGSSGVYACMNHSVLDERNPLMREYAILALRNLLEEHEENQRVVQELRMEGVANQQELKEMGVQTEVDQETGSIRIRNQQSKPQQQG